MESDYYLHVKNDRAMHQSIKSYETAFAVHWTDDDELYKNSNERRLVRHTSTDTNVTLDSSFYSVLTTANTLMDRNQRMERIQNRSKAQNVALSLWWRAAIQSYVQQRMWLARRKSSTASSQFKELDDMNNDSSFERRYQPTKLTQFDKIFARSWAIPLQSPYDSNMNPNSPKQVDDIINESGAKNFLTGPFSKTRSMDSPKRKERSDEKSSVYDDSSDEECLTLREYLKQHGFQNRKVPTLQHFVKPFEVNDTCEDGWNYTTLDTKESYDHSISYHSTATSSSTQDPFDTINTSLDHAKKTKNSAGNNNITYLGDLANHNIPCKEYRQYAAPSDETVNLSTLTDDAQEFPYFFRPDVRKEFEQCLYETNLHSDDVEGIRKVSYLLFCI